jgi:hypothetical protein
VLFFLKKRKKQIENWASTKKLNSPWLGLKVTRLRNPGKRQVTLGQAQGSRVEPDLSLSVYFSVFNFNLKTVFL